TCSLTCEHRAHLSRGEHPGSSETGPGPRLAGRAVPGLDPPSERDAVRSGPSTVEAMGAAAALHHDPWPGPGQAPACRRRLWRAVSTRYARDHAEPAPQSLFRQVIAQGPGAVGVERRVSAAAWGA